jgi:hypothetical protein
MVNTQTVSTNVGNFTMTPERAMLTTLMASRGLSLLEAFELLAATLQKSLPDYDNLMGKLTEAYQILDAQGVTKTELDKLRNLLANCPEDIR